MIDKALAVLSSSRAAATDIAPQFALRYKKGQTENRSEAALCLGKLRFVLRSMVCADAHHSRRFDESCGFATRGRDVRG